MIRSADYDETIELSIQVLKAAGITQFPVDLDLIFKHFSLILRRESYSVFCSKHNMTRVDAINRVFDSEYGCTIADCNGHYIIYFNDYKDPGVIRITLGHELGHVFMGHPDEAGCSMLRKDAVGKALYNVMENEAWSFGRNLLAPAPCVKKLADEFGITKRYENGQTIWESTKETYATVHLASVYKDFSYLIEQTFQVSPKEADVRKGLLDTDAWHISNRKIDTSFLDSIENKAMYYCGSCQTERLGGTVYCTECGGIPTFHYGIPQKNYHHDLGDIREGFLLTCPICGNTIQEKTEFCKICGTPLANRCTENPSHLNHPEAKYCYLCGEETIYYQRHLTGKISENLEEKLHMIYPNTIEYDEKTMRVKKCPVCENEVFGSDAEYCRICGTETINYCDPIRRDNWIPNPHACTPDSRYCEVCGGETVYFTRGILKPYTAYLKTNNIFKDLA